MFRDSAGLEPDELDFYDADLMRNAFNEVFRELERNRLQEQARLDYIRALLTEIIQIGNKVEAGELNGQTSGSFTFNAKEWSVLRDHMKYAHDFYHTIDPWQVHLIDGSSVNFGLLPGISLDREMFMNEKVDESALEIFIHEPMHNFDRLGIGHALNGLNAIIGPGSADNYFSRLIDFLRNTKCDGKSLWDNARENARDRLRVQ
jgi:hypothetical protein